MKMRQIRSMIWGVNGLLVILIAIFVSGRFSSATLTATKELSETVPFPHQVTKGASPDDYAVIWTVPNPIKKDPPPEPPEERSLVLSSVLKIVGVDVNPRQPEKSSVLLRIENQNYGTAKIGGAVVDERGDAITLTRDYRVIEIYWDRVVFKHQRGMRAVVYIDAPVGNSAMSRSSPSSGENPAELYYQQGLAMEENFRFEEAESFYNKLIEQMPHAPEAYVARGRIKRRATDFTGAIQDLDRAIELNPNAFDGYALRAVSKYWAGDRAGAIEDADLALGMNPYNAEVYFIRAYARRDMGDVPEDVQRDLELSRMVNPLVTAKDHFDLATTHLMDRKFQEAMPVYDTVLRLSPNFSSAYGNRGWCKYHLGDYEGAIADYTRSMEITPAFRERALQLIEMARAQMRGR